MTDLETQYKNMYKGNLSTKERNKIYEEAKEAGIVDKVRIEEREAKEEKTATDLGNRNWGDARVIIAVILVEALVLALIFWVIYKTDFTAGVFKGFEWVSAGGGFWFFLLFGLTFVGASSSAFFTQGLGQSIGISIIMMFVYAVLMYFAIYAMRVGAQTAFWLAVVFSILLSIGTSIWTLWKLHSLKSYDKSGKGVFDTRFKWAMGMSVVSAIGSIGLAIASFKINGTNTWIA